MATNHYFSQKVKSEQNLYEDIIIESLKIYGQDVYYIPREIVNEDRILGDDIQSSFSNSYKIEMYIENTEGFDGEGDLFTKFGIEIRDQATFIVSRKRWNQTVGRYDNEINSVRPREGDLVYLSLSNSLFQIQHVEHESPFYQISNLPTYKMRCELFEYSGEALDTGIDAIDNIEADFGYQYVLTVDATRTTALGDVGITDSGSIGGLRLTDPGAGYFDAPPLVTISTTDVGTGAEVVAVIDSDLGQVTDLVVIDPGLGYTTADLTVAPPPVITFTKGEPVYQTLSDGTIIEGEVSDWNDSSGILKVVSVGGDDGQFHSFTTGVPILASDNSGGIVTAVVEDNQLSENEQNLDFETDGLEFLDFTDENPVGDPQ